MKKILIILPLILLLSACSTHKSNGQSDGNGSEEESGVKVLHGKGAPSSSLGNDFDHYYDEESRYVYERNNGKWINQFTKGSPSLYSDGSKKKELKRAYDPNDKNVLKNALATSFYSTNMTAQMEPHFKDGSQGWGLMLEISGQNLKISDIEGQAAFSNPYYIRMNDDGIIDVYQDGQYKKVTDYHDNIYCMVPHPTLENITYSNYLLYDDNEGQMTSLVCANLNNATYDEKTGYYELNNIVASHEAITSHYFSNPQADNLRFNFKFKLSQDQSYVESAFIDYISSEFYENLSNLTIEYKFSNMHTTVVEMPK